MSSVIVDILILAMLFLFIIMLYVLNVMLYEQFNNKKKKTVRKK